jgi:RNA 2',3'-cyclic 3'-phosphodiesterase
VREILSQIKSASARGNQGRTVDCANLHLTLQFLGGVVDEQIERLEEVATQLQTEPFLLTLDQFGHWDHPRILWLGPLITPVPLLALQAGLETALIQQCGFVPEARRYRPHVTLMRKVDKVETLPQIEPLTWPVDQFSLMESLSSPAGVVYKTLNQWPLSTK